jgi:hypothetical protein
MKNKLYLLMLMLITAAPAALQAESTLQRLKNLFKTKEQRLKEQEDQKRKELEEKLRIESQKKLDARNKACGIKCTNPKQKCCVSTTNGSPYTYCAEKCNLGSAEVE